MNNPRLVAATQAITDDRWVLIPAPEGEFGTSLAESDDEELAVSALQAADDSDREDGIYRVKLDATAVERVADELSRHSGMKFDGFWTPVAELDDESRADALEEARAVIEVLKINS